MTADFWIGLWLGMGAGGLLMFVLAFLLLRWVVSVTSNPWR